MSIQEFTKSWEFISFAGETGETYNCSEMKAETALPRDKIKTVHELAGILDKLRENKKKIVHCHGVFDLIHIGHIRHFEQARRLGDVLVVTLTPDRFVDKGPHRPAFTETLRAEALASLSFIDFVAVNEWPTAEETLRLLQPDIFAKGSEFKSITTDMTGKIGMEEKVVRELGAQIAFTEDIVFSSSNLINRYLSDLPEAIQNYLDVFRTRHSLNEILDILDRMHEMKVLVVGDTILDEYQYCEAIGKSSKDPIIALKYKSHELFAGGALAVANHVANFASEVRIATIIGDQDNYEEFIRSKLLPNVAPKFFVQPGAPTTVKRRFVDGYTFNKLFEVYVMDDTGSTLEKQFSDWLKKESAGYDVVIAADFGHGAIGKKTVDGLVKNSRFLAVNTQANAGNRGFHTVTRYPHADFACLAEHEIRLEMRSVTGKLLPMVKQLAEKLNTRQFIVTRGRRGCMVWSEGEGLVEVPSFATRTVDRVGAGDAFFSVTSMASAMGVPNEPLGFIGNLVGSLAVEVIGNQKAIDKLSVKKYATSLMK